MRVEQALWEIPDGFYGVADSAKPEPAFQKAIIDAVEQVTHIAPSDENGYLIGSKTEQRGVINYPIERSWIMRLLYRGSLRKHHRSLP